jgi:hypothetical protein
VTNEAEWRTLLDMLERVAEGLHDEAKAKRVNRRNIGAAGNSIQMVVQQGRALLGHGLGATPPR